MAADTLKLKASVSNLLDQVFSAASGGVDAASPLVQNRELRAQNALLQRQLALLREADDAEFDQLHDYLGSLHVRLAKLEQDYAALESRQAEAEAVAEQHGQLALVPVLPAEEAGTARDVAALLDRVAPSLERLPGIEAQLGELASLRADMQAAVQALQHAQQQPQPANAGQLDKVNKELRALRKVVQQQQRDASGPPGTPSDVPAAVERAKEGAQTVAAGEEPGKRRRTHVEEEPPTAKRPAAGAVWSTRDSAVEAPPSRSATPRLPDASGQETGTPLGHTSPHHAGSGEAPAELPQQAVINGAEALDQLEVTPRRHMPVQRRQDVEDKKGYPWRCALCCYGYKFKYALAKHFRSQQHVTFAKDVYEFLANRSAATNKRFPDGEYVRNPFPKFNRKSGEELRPSNTRIWQCQICNARLNGLQWLVHLFSQKHTNALKALLDGPVRTPPPADAAPQTG